VEGGGAAADWKNGSSENKTPLVPHPDLKEGRKGAAITERRRE